MQITGLEATDIGQDVLLVRATVNGLSGVFEAHGWVSATTNHFDDDTLEKDGHRPRTAKSRVMTKAEVEAYLERILVEQNPDLASYATEPVRVFARNPEAITAEIGRTVT